MRNYNRDVNGRDLSLRLGRGAQAIRDSHSGGQILPVKMARDLIRFLINQKRRMSILGTIKNEAAN